MKIGILTFHNIPNFGAMFQAYALCIFIRNHWNSECEIIDYRCENITKRELTFKRSDNPVINTIRKLSWVNTERKIKLCNEYISSKGLVSAKTYNRNDIIKANDEYDVFISGSDMIWDKDVTAGDRTFFLDFTDEYKKRFAYGSSTAKASIIIDDVDCINKYNDVAVREQDVCDKLLENGIKCQVVCDPTMLIKREEWVDTCRDIDETGYVLVYFPTNKLLKTAWKYAKKQHKKLYSIEMIRKSIVPHKTLRVYDPEKWLGYIKNADAVFTNSYHGVLFSLYFHKEFWTMNDGNRVSSILNKLGLNSRIIPEGSTICESNTIDYLYVDRFMDEFRTKSQKYIEQIILGRQ